MLPRFKELVQTEQVTTDKYIYTSLLNYADFIGSQASEEQQKTLVEMDLKFQLKSQMLINMSNLWKCCCLCWNVTRVHQERAFLEF